MMQAGTMMAMQFLQAADMIARLPLPASLPPPKRQRPEYFDSPFGPWMGMTGCDKSVGVPYGPHIHNEMPSGGSYESHLPPNASNTLYVDGLPTNCTRRELTRILFCIVFSFYVYVLTNRPLNLFCCVLAFNIYCFSSLTLLSLDIFRRFTGFCDVRLVNRGFNNRHVIAFVDFDTPGQAFSAMESLQGYMFDIYDPYTHKLHLQFSSPGPRSGDGPRGRR
ncbi:nuclear speckle RNA-binding protein B-like [Lolium perenne]|uniref:nuclear speckle RNA-binding protein B-like n=1 Tax=Lolium perenne TaxID=4522 RepID=UPI0021F55FFC|nr:nuclear speckle RNA-binding protein B-like [Lolium perenne]